jgi:hypothetical protein
LGPSVEELIATELHDSHSYRGRSVFGWEPPPEDAKATHPEYRATGAGQEARSRPEA